MSAPEVALATQGINPKTKTLGSLEAEINAGFLEIFEQVAAVATGLAPAGNWDASAGAFPSGASLGTYYIVDTAGTVDSQAFAVGDWLIPLIASPSTSTYAGNWLRGDYSQIVPGGLPVKSFATHAALIADVTMGYSGASVIVTEGDFVVYGNSGYRAKVAASGASDHDMITAGGVKLYVMPMGNVWDVAALALDTTGTSDVTADLQALLTQAGAGATIRFEAGATYLVSGPLTTATRQRIVGNGAQLKRVDQVVTTTTTAITAGATTSVTLNDATGLAVGMYVAFAEQGVARSAVVYGSTLSAKRQITNVNSNTITLAAAPDIDVSTGGTCFLAFNCLILANGARAEGLRFDGNRANWSYGRWEVVRDLETVLGTADQQVLDCQFDDAPGEACYLQASRVTARGNVFKNIAGNPLHLSGATGALIAQNICVNGNLDVDVGHADGFVAFSLSNAEVTVSDNQATGCLAGVGGVTTSNSDITIADNQFFDMDIAGIEVAAGVDGLSIIGNRIDGCALDPSRKTGETYYGGIVLAGLTNGGVHVADNIVRNVTSAAGTYAFAIGTSGSPAGFKILDNTFEDTCNFSGMADFDVRGNTVSGRFVVGGNEGGVFADSTIIVGSSTNGLDLNATADYIDIEFRNTVIRGGQNGINVGTSATTYRDIRFRGTRIYDPSNRGVSFVSFSNTLDGMWFEDTLIVAGATSPSSFQAFVIQNDGISILRSILHNTQTTGTQIAINVAGGAASKPKLVVAFNEIRGAGWNNSINLAASMGCWVKDNIVESATTNQSGNNVSGEIVI